MEPAKEEEESDEEEDEYEEDDDDGNEVCRSAQRSFLRALLSLSCAGPAGVRPDGGATSRCQSKRERSLLAEDMYVCVYLGFVIVRSQRELACCYTRRVTHSHASSRS